jgi:hypothetical protein
MAQPPDFGGREIEEGLLEDLGVPEHEHDRAARPHPGHSDLDDAAAPGQVCALCGTRITEGQDARRRPDGRWMHEVCPA